MEGAKFRKSLSIFNLLTIPVPVGWQVRGKAKQCLKNVPPLSLTPAGARVFAKFRGIRSLSSDYTLPLEVLEPLLTLGRYKTIRLHGITEAAFPFIVKCSLLDHLTLVAPLVNVANEQAWMMLAALPRLTHLELTSEVGFSSAKYDSVKSYFAGSRINVTTTVSY